MANDILLGDLGSGAQHVERLQIVSILAYIMMLLEVC